MSDKDEILGAGTIVYTSIDPDLNAYSLKGASDYINDATVTKRGNSSKTKDDGSNAAVYTGDSGSVTFDNSEIYTDGYMADGGYTDDENSYIEFKNSTISINGNTSSGLYIKEGKGKLDTCTGELNANRTNIARVDNNGHIDIENSTIVSKGINAPIININSKGSINSNNSTYESSTSDLVSIDNGEFTSTNDTFNIKGKDISAINIKGAIGVVNLNSAKLNFDNNSNGFAFDIAADSIINITGDTTINAKQLISEGGVTSTVINISNQTLEINCIELTDSKSRLEINLDNATLVTKIDPDDTRIGYISINLKDSTLKLTADSHISAFDVEGDLNQINTEDYHLYVDGEVYVEGLDVGSVVDYKSKDGSVYEKNCIIIKKYVDEEDNDIVKFVVYDADKPTDENGDNGHISYVATEEELKILNKKVDVEPLLDEITKLLKDINAYVNHSTIYEKDSDEPGILVDNETLELTDMTVYKAGDSKNPDDQSYNSAALVTNTGEFTLSDSLILSRGNNSDGIRTIKNSKTTLTNTSVTTYGDDSSGLYVDNSTLISTENTVNTYGLRSPAVTSKGDSNVTINGGYYKSEESNAIDIEDNSKVVASNTTFESVDSTPVNIKTNGSAAYQFNNVDIIQSTNDGNYSIRSEGKGIATGSISNSSIETLNGSTISNSGTYQILDITNCNIDNSSDKKILAESVDNGYLEINAHNQTFNGNFYCEQGSTLILNLDNSKLNGTVGDPNVKPVDLEVHLRNGSRWSLTDDAYLSSFDFDETSSYVLNGHKIYIYDTELQRYLIYEPPVHLVNKFEEKDDIISQRILKVIHSSKLPPVDERDENYIYLIYDKLRIYINRTKFNDAFVITNKLPDPKVMVENMLYILNTDIKNTSYDPISYECYTDDSQLPFVGERYTRYYVADLEKEMISLIRWDVDKSYYYVYRTIAMANDATTGGNHYVIYPDSSKLITNKDDINPNATYYVFNRDEVSLALYEWDSEANKFTMSNKEYNTELAQLLATKDPTNETIIVASTEDDFPIPEGDSTSVYYAYKDAKLYEFTWYNPFRMYIQTSSVTESFEHRAGDTFIYRDYQVVQVAELESITDSNGYSIPDPDQVAILQMYGTTAFMNAEFRYIDKQTRTIDLPFQNGHYQLTFNLDKDLQIDDDTIIRYNKEKEQWYIDGNHLIDNRRLRNPDKYTGGVTSTAITTVSDSTIKSDVRLSDNDNNAIEIKDNHGLFVDVSKFASASDYEDIAYRFASYKNTIDSYLAELAEAVKEVTGSVSIDVINQQIMNTLNDYDARIQSLINNYQLVYERNTQLAYDASTGVDQKVAAAKQEIIDYVNSLSEPWEATSGYTETEVSESQYQLQSMILDNLRSTFIELRETNEDSGSYNSYGLTEDEQDIQDNIMNVFSDKTKYFKTFRFYSSYDNLPSIGEEGALYIISTNNENGNVYVLDDSDSLYHKYTYDTDNDKYVDSGETISNVNDKYIYQIYDWELTTDSTGNESYTYNKIYDINS